MFDFEGRLDSWWVTKSRKDLAQQGIPVAIACSHHGYSSQWSLGSILECVQMLDIMYVMSELRLCRPASEFFFAFYQFHDALTATWVYFAPVKAPLADLLTW
ncbi:hypothetical protein KC19_2G164000 [Ceratodon purpureus]|uniref:Uncharacterized protein n=1 Tax=Ceratodon purpureus TaxID=3225 RepID=A0A8T0IUM0_CERPU|nr:hypothetical protein KC19_2G164000 [Ceratodon purpureus]